VRVEKTARAVIAGNASLLHSALENVLRNTDEGSTAELSMEPDPVQSGRLVIRVRDHRPGVPGEMLPRLFEPFVRAGDARDRATGGYGLGLAIAERAVRLHGGEMSARNEPDGGFSVLIYLPLQQTPSSEDRTAA
jgi:two-component system sensor histidine kinase CpxA